MRKTSMAYLHCRIEIPFLIPIQTKWLYFTMENFSHCTELDSDSRPITNYRNMNGIGT